MWGYAEEALSAIRTVYAFCAEEIEKNKYLSELGKAQSATMKNSLLFGLALGMINFSIAFIDGLGHLIGSLLIQYDVYNHTKNKDYDCGTILAVFFSVYFATGALAMIAPQLKDIG